MNGLTICMFARYGSGDIGDGKGPQPLGMYDGYPDDVFLDLDNWDGFWNRQFFFYFVAIGYFFVIAVQTMGTMFGDRNQVECIASNFIGFFLYIAAGSVVVWSYTFEIDEGQEYREGMKKRGLSCGCLMILQGFFMAIDSYYRIPKMQKQMAMARRGR